MILLIIAPTCFVHNSWPSSRTSQVFLFVLLICQPYLVAVI